MPSIYKKIEVVGTSKVSFTEATKAAVEEGGEDGEAPGLVRGDRAARPHREGQGG